MGQRLIISEEEKKHILGLHKSNIFESGPEGQDPSQQQIATTNGSSGSSGSSGTSGVTDNVVTSSSKNTKVGTLQTKMNEKFKSGLKADNRWGPKTATAVLNALKSLEVPQEVQTQQPSQVEEPTQYLPILPAGTVQRPSQPAQLAGQK